MNDQELKQRISSLCFQGYPPELAWGVFIKEIEGRRVIFMDTQGNEFAETWPRVCNMARRDDGLMAKLQDTAHVIPDEFVDQRSGYCRY